MNIREIRIRSPLGVWTRHEWEPEPGDALAGLVESVVHAEGTAEFPRERVFPDTCIEVLVHVGEPHRLVGTAGAAPLPAVTLAGIQTGPMVLEAPPGCASGLGIRLRPSGALALLGCPLVEVCGQVLDLADCIGRAAVELAGLCEDASSAEERIRRAVRWLGERFLRSWPIDPAIAWAAACIERNGGAGSIGDLRSRIGLSWSRFTTRFREQVGVTPKRYARIARFRRALTLLHEGRTPSLATAALTAGYYDQAHMNADFRSLAGLTPGQFLAAPRVPNWITVTEPSR